MILVIKAMYISFIYFTYVIFTLTHDVGSQSRIWKTGSKHLYMILLLRAMYTSFIYLSKIILSARP